MTTKTKNGNIEASQRGQQHFRIGFSDLEPIWNAEQGKYKVLCGTHVTRAALLIAYVQLGFAIGFSISVGYLNYKSVRGNSDYADERTVRYMSKLMLGNILQICILAAMIHGIKKERKSLLIPYLILGAIAVFGSIILTIAYFDIYGPKGESISRLLGTLIQAWCLSVVWRCYCYLGDKQVAQQIRQRLAGTTANAYHYPEQLIGNAGYSPMSQPPPYSDIVVNTTAPAPPAMVVVGPKSEKQQPIENNMVAEQK